MCQLLEFVHFCLGQDFIAAGKTLVTSGTDDDTGSNFPLKDPN